jgi:hypothetical protein
MTARTSRGERPGKRKENKVQQDPTQEIASLEESSQPMLRWLHDLKVTSPEEQKNAEDLLITARQAWKAADEKRRELTRPLDDAKQRIIELFKPYMNRLDTGINILNRELTRYHEGLVALRREEERRTLEAQAARIKEAAQTGEVVEPAEAPAVPNVAKTSRANLGTVTYREEWDVQVVDAARVPRDLCEPSLPRIRARVKSGVTDIPGVLVTKKLVSVARS